MQNSTNRKLPITEATILSAFFYKNHPKDLTHYNFSVLNNRKYYPVESSKGEDEGYYSRYFHGGAHFNVQHWEQMTENYRKFGERKYYYLTHAQLRDNRIQYMELREDLINIWKMANEKSLTILSISDTGALWVIPVAKLLNMKPYDTETNLQCNNIIKYALSDSPDYVFSGNVTDEIQKSAEYISDSWIYMGHYSYADAESLISGKSKKKYEKQSAGYSAVYGGSTHPYKSARHLYDELLAPIGYTKSYEAFKKSLYRNNHTFNYTRESDGLEIEIRLSKNSDFIGLKKSVKYISPEALEQKIDALVAKVSRNKEDAKMETHKIKHEEPEKPAVKKEEKTEQKSTTPEIKKISWNDWDYHNYPQLILEYGGDLAGWRQYLKAVS